jgi:hypothetical protein
MATDDLRELARHAAHYSGIDEVDELVVALLPGYGVPRPVRGLPTASHR